MVNSYEGVRRMREGVQSHWRSRVLRGGGYEGGKMRSIFQPNAPSENEEHSNERQEEYDGSQELRRKW